MTTTPQETLDAFVKLTLQLGCYGDPVAVDDGDPTVTATLRGLADEAAEESTSEPAGPPRDIRFVNLFLANAGTYAFTNGMTLPPGTDSPAAQYFRALANETP